MATTAPNPKLKAFEDKVSAQMQDAKTKLDQLEAKAKEKRAQAEIAAVNDLKATREHINQKVQDMKTAHASNVARAKSDINEAVAQFKSALSKLKTVGD
jgi:hypothetical protein